MRKRRAVLICALVLLAAMVAWGTWAYFTAEAHVTNVITTGTIHITLNDEMEGATLQGDGTTAVLDGVMPGRQIAKTVSVTNSGSGDAWVRVKVATDITGPDKAALSTTIQHDGLTESAVQIGYHTGEGKWVDGGDGYYYYTQPLAAKDTTENLFDTVTLNRFLSNEYQGCTVDVSVSAQAVQTKNNTIDSAAGQTVLQVQGWPAD